MDMDFFLIELRSYRVPPSPSEGERRVPPSPSEGERRVPPNPSEGERRVPPNPSEGERSSILFRKWQKLLFMGQDLFLD
jgi:hypothetical protein